MKIRKVLCLTVLMSLLSPSILTNAENNLLSGLSLNYSKVSNVLGNIEINSKDTGQLIQLPNGNYVKSINNNGDNNIPFKINYQVSKPKNYSFTLKTNDKKNFVENIDVNDLTLNATVIGKNKVTLNLNSEDTTSSVTSMRFSNDVPYSEKYDWTVEDTDGIHTIYVQFKDKANNLSKPTSTILYLDKTAPKVNFKINNNQNLTNDKTLSLDLSIKDVSDIKTIYVSEDNKSWKEFSGELRNIKYDITGDSGDKEIYIKAEDVWGNMSSPVFKKIKFDNEKPTGSLIVNNGATSTTSNKVNVSVKFSDKVSGIKKVSIKEGSKIIDLSKEQISKGSLSLPWTLNYGSSVHLDLEIVDNAGNTSVISSNPIKVIINDLKIKKFKLNNVFDKKNEDKFTPLTWTFPSQSMLAGANLKFEIEFIKPNISDNVTVNGDYTIAILNDNGYSKVQKINLSKNNNVDDIFVGEFTIPKDVPVNSKVYFNCTLNADMTKDGKTTSQQVIFPFKNSQAEIGHIVGNVKDSLKFSQIK